MLTLDQLNEILPKSEGATALYLDAINLANDEFDISNPDRVAAYIANVAVETAELTAMSENLFYTHAQHIADVWPSRFPTASIAAPYVGQPQKLANVVYANRMGNGPVESGDGWNFRGGGCLQVTGRRMYELLAEHFQMDVNDAGSWVRTPSGAARSGAWYFATNGCNELADAQSFTAIVRKINGALTGIAQRWQYLATARGVLGADA